MSGSYGRSHRDATNSRRAASSGNPNGIERSYASQLKESEPLFNTYEHLKNLPRGDAALTMLRKVASMVKPIMRKRGWSVQVLAEFLPQEQNLLGLNINKGYKICIRLRYHNNPDLFLPIEQVVDTMLHELSHIIWGEHDSRFHALWDELRDEYEVLVRKGYTGEGFLSAGHRLGGSSSNRMPPQHEMRRLARASAEKRKVQGTLGAGSGQRLGGAPVFQYGGDIRQIIANQATRRNVIDQGCASGRNDAAKLSEQASNNTFKTQAEEDDANDRAIAQALFDLMEEEEAEKLRGDAVANSTSAGLAWDPKTGLYAMPGPNTSYNVPPNNQPSYEEQMKWAMQESLDDVKSVGGPKSSPPVPLHSKPIPAESHHPEQIPGDDVRNTLPAKRKQPASPKYISPPSANSKSSNKSSSTTPIDLTSVAPDRLPDTEQWTCPTCTLINPLQFLTCDVCATERPPNTKAKPTQKKSRSTTTSSIVKPKRTVMSVEDIKLPPEKEGLGWACGQCGSFMEHQWWTCSACGKMKDAS